MKFRKICLFYTAVFVIVICLNSCTSIDANYISSDEGFRVYLDDMKGVLLFDQALMNFGEPASVFQGDKIFIATWGTESLGGAVFPVGNALFAFPLRDGWKLELSFNKISRKMVGWNYDTW